MEGGREMSHINSYDSLLHTDSKVLMIVIRLLLPVTEVLIELFGSNTDQVRQGLVTENLLLIHI